MRAMWRVHGKPGGAREGYVDRPYTSADAEARLAEVSGDAAFAARLFRAATFTAATPPTTPTLLAPRRLRGPPAQPGTAWWGDFRLEPRGGRTDDRQPGRRRIAGLCRRPRSGRRAAASRRDAACDPPSDVTAVVQRHRPGDRLRVTISSTGPASKRPTTVTLAADPHLEVVPVEATGAALTPAQRAFREHWLAGK